jgi:hypothetical protein
MRAGQPTDQLQPRRRAFCGSVVLAGHVGAGTCRPATPVAGRRRGSLGLWSADAVMRPPPTNLGAWEGMAMAWPHQAAVGN